ncbi:MAG: DNA primase [Thermoanaerobaculia bacterium]
MSFVDLNDAIISQVRQSADLVEIVGQVTPLKSAGRRHKGLCPFHREKTPSFTVDREKGLFYCFGCQAGGDVFKFLMLTERMTFPEAVASIAERVGIELPKRRVREKENRERDELGSIVEEAAEAFHQALEWEPNPAIQYLATRGVAREVWKKYGFGYAPDAWDYLLRRLGRKHNAERLEAAGLILPRKSGSGHYDRFRNRLIVPIHSESGTVLGFGGRSLDGSDPKYLNSPESQLFNKSQLLFNLHRAKDQIRRMDRAILVEGYFDCITLDAAGVNGVVASMGTALTPAQASILGRLCRRVVISYDGDDAGRKAALRAAPILLSAGVAVEVLALERGSDPDSYLREHGLEAFMEALGNADDVFEFALREFAPNPSAMGSREKQEKLESFVPLLSAVTGVSRNDAAQRIADGLRLEFETVWSMLRGRGGQGSTREKVAMAPVADGERRVLAAVLGNGMPAETVERLREEYFEDDACKTIYLTIKDSLPATEPLDFSKIATHLRGEAVLTRLSEIALGEESEERGFDSLETTIQHLERRFINRQLREIQSALQEAQREGDGEKEIRLLGEKSELSRKLHKLK